MAVENTLGKGLQVVKRFAMLSLTNFGANTTVTRRTGFSVPAGSGEKFRIKRLSVLTDAVPSDADGTLLLNAFVRDVSEGAADQIVTSADLEALVTAADRNFALTLNAETSEFELTMDEGDSMYFTLVNNSAAIDTNPNVFVVVEYFLIPKVETEQVGYPSQYGV